MANRSYVTVNQEGYIPQVGDFCHGKDLGHTSDRGYMVYVYTQCPRCKNFRWVTRKSLLQTKTGLCRKCFYETWRPQPNTKGKYQQSASHNWKGGKVRLAGGYIAIRIYKDDFFWSMANRKESNCGAGYVFEHRLVMAKHLGRCLHLWEIVHHKNGNKTDNRIENLQLVTDDRHKQITVLERRIRFLETRITQLEAEIVLLKTTDGVTHGK